MSLRQLYFDPKINKDNPEFLDLIFKNKITIEEFVTDFESLNTADTQQNKRSYLHRFRHSSNLVSDMISEVSVSIGSFMPTIPYYVTQIHRDRYDALFNSKEENKKEIFEKWFAQSEPAEKIYSSEIECESLVKKIKMLADNFQGNSKSVNEIKMILNWVAIDPPSLSYSKALKEINEIYSRRFQRKHDAEVQKFFEDMSKIPSVNTNPNSSTAFIFKTTKPTPRLLEEDVTQHHLNEEMIVYIKFNNNPELREADEKSESTEHPRDALLRLEREKEDWRSKWYMLTINTKDQEKIASAKSEMDRIGKEIEEQKKRLNTWISPISTQQKKPLTTFVPPTCNFKPPEPVPSTSGYFSPVTNEHKKFVIPAYNSAPPQQQTNSMSSSAPALKNNNC